ncbi:AraC family transcriptional regulator [Saccharopolyspora rhizosphaerae]|uniref:AraC family transcriptional regulator n=2 Tax=Saccharopolyspora rhizosphaerae TaxID=2492662 RepID=A0A3R8NXY5_9PSEU|nr:AraC family transcriptional regulator [Saccharopolyspora rhizosphaerae]
MAGFAGETTDVVDLPVVPHPAVTLFVDLGDALLIDDARGVRERGGVVAGLAPRGVRGSGQDIECLQVRLAPDVAHAVLGTTLSGSVLALGDVWPSHLPDQLRDLASWDDRFALVEAALAERYEAGRSVDPEVAFAWRRLVERRGQVRIERLADEIGWSRKRLWARFSRQIGLGPKRAAQLVRFDHAVHRLVAGESPASVAAGSGYVDQAHLHHEVKEFAGLTPAAVAGAQWLAVDDVAWARPSRPSIAG